MKYFAVFSPMLDEEKNKHYRPDHLAFIQEQLDKGNIFAKGRFADGAGGLVIYQADSYAEVEAIAKQDPYVIKGARGYIFMNGKCPSVNCKRETGYLSYRYPVSRFWNPRD